MDRLVKDTRTTLYDPETGLVRAFNVMAGERAMGAARGRVSWQLQIGVWFLVADKLVDVVLAILQKV